MNWHEGLRRIKLAGQRLMLSSIAGALLWFLLLFAFRVDLFGLFFMIGVPFVLGCSRPGFLKASWACAPRVATAHELLF
jgi:hypothetical protein